MKNTYLEKAKEFVIKKEYNKETKTMSYFTPYGNDNRIFSNDAEEMNTAILNEFYTAVEWLLGLQYEEYYEITSRTINPAQQNAFLPLREYRVKRNGHYRWVNIHHRFWGGCWIEMR